MLRRYWFEFEEPSAGALPPGTRAGCGVTAYSHDDGLAILRQRVFPGGDVPTIRKVVEDVDVSCLDPQHVIPNMGSVSRRGVWYPLGYD